MTLSARTSAALAAIASGERRGMAAALPMMGPAFMASIAYMDPGNFATNIEAGASYRYELLWVVLCANIIAMLFQGLSARLGLVTGKNLAELCRAHFPKPVVLAMWGVSEIGAMATDLAEFIGAAIGLALLFHLPLLAGMAITGILVYGILVMQRRGYRALELTITGFVGVIALCYLAELWLVSIPWDEAAYHSLVPVLRDDKALTLSVGIIGATVMPHAIYLHSGLVQNRVSLTLDVQKARLLRLTNFEVITALSLAGLVNMAMVMVSASAFAGEHAELSDIGDAYATLIPISGAAAAGLFLTSLLASGISSSVVGTLAGQLIMQGFVNFSIPLWLRRALTMAPAFVVIALGANATQVLVMSQVVLSFVLPVPMVALLLLVRRKDIMGAFALSGIWQRLAFLCTIIVLALNAVLIWQTLFGV